MVTYLKYFFYSFIVQEIKASKKDSIIQSNQPKAINHDDNYQANQTKYELCHKEEDLF